MSQENIDFGNFPNDANADAIRTAFQKAQNNFTELYNTVLVPGITNVNPGVGINTRTNSPGNITISANIQKVTIQTDDNLLVGISTATGNSATITSGNTPLALKLANTLTVDTIDASNITVHNNFNVANLSVKNLTGGLENLTVLNNVTAGNFIGNFTNVIDQLILPGSDTQLLVNKNNHINAISNVTFTDSTSTLAVRGNIQANFFIGNGNAISNIQAANIYGTVANANYALYAGNVINPTQSNITNVGILANLTVDNNILPNIDSTYSLGSYARVWKELWISGTAINMKTSVGNAKITATSNTIVLTNPTGGKISVSDTTVIDGTNISNGNSNIKIYANSNAAVSIAGKSNVVIISNLGVTANGTIGANYFNGDGSNLTNLGNANYAAYAGNITVNAQSNITSVGILKSLTIANTGTGNVTSDNANLGNLAKANYFSGSGNLLSNIQASNITGTVANATYAASAGSADSSANANYAAYAGNITVNAQPNITSLGTLKSLIVANTGKTGNITSDNANLGNLVTANYITVSNDANIVGTLTTNVANVISNLIASNANFTNGLTAKNANITGDIIFTGTNVNLGTVGNLRVLGGNPGQILKRDNLTNSNNLVFGDLITNGIVNANSNVSIPSANGNVIFSVDSVPNVLVVTSNSANLKGNFIISGYANANGNISTSNYFLGNGYYLSNVQTAVKLVDGTSNVVVSGSPTSGSVLFTNAPSPSSLTIPYNTIFGLKNTDFTFEVWVYPTALGSGPTGQKYMTILSRGQGATEYSFRLSNGLFTFVYSTSATADTPQSLNSTKKIELNKWTHLAFSRVNSTNTCYMFINGVLETSGGGTGGNPLRNTTEDTGIGALLNANSPTSPTQLFYGYISNLRLVKGVAVYTSVFTPSTLPLTSTQSANINGNPSTAITGTQTVLLTCQYGGYIDYSKANNGSNWAISLGTGSVTISALSPFTLLPSINMSVNDKANVLVITSTDTNVNSNLNVLGNNSINSNGNVSFGSNANVSFANIANLYIPGGKAGYVLITDGRGKLSWANLSAISKA
jgi:hypothetical protein